MTPDDFYATSWHRRQLEAEITRRAGGVRGRVLDVGSPHRRYDSVFREAAVIVALDRIPPVSSPAVCADAGAIPFATGAFDSVCAIEVFEYVEDLAAVIGEIHRVLKPGGNLLFSVPFLNPVHGEACVDDPKTDLHRYTIKALHRSLVPRFHPVEVEAFGGPRGLLVDLWLQWARVRAPILRAMLLPATRMLCAWARRGGRRVGDARYAMGYIGLCRKVPLCMDGGTP